MSAYLPSWSGHSVKALRAARRMSLRAFAEHLGVSDRMVSKWEAGGENIRPRSVNQAALDTSLATAGRDVILRFERLVGVAPLSAVIDIGPTAQAVARHPIDQRLMAYFDHGPFEDEWLPGFFLDHMPVSNGDYAAFVAATDHRPPIHWPDGCCPERLLDAPVEVPWIDAQAYCQWASKELPTEAQLRRAIKGDEGVVFGTPTEWVSTPKGPDRFEAGGAVHGKVRTLTFRTALDGEAMLRLLLA